MAKAKDVKVALSDPPESTEILAASIKRISDSLSRLTRGGLNEKAIVALIHDDTKIGKQQIQIVLNSLKSLQVTYCNH